MQVPAAKDLARVLPSPLWPWITHFCDSAREVGVPAELLAAICWRESRGGLILLPYGSGPMGTGDWTYDPETGSRIGDIGHGRGLMQIDDRFHRDFLAKVDGNGQPLWTLPAENIRYGAQILKADLAAFDYALEAGVAAYNAGGLKVQAALKRGESVDSVTTGRDYAHEVVSHTLEWHQADPEDCRCCVCTYRKEIRNG